VIWSINYNETNALKFNKVDVKDSSFNKKSYLEMADKVFSQPFMSPTYKYNIAFTLLQNGHISESVADFKKILIVDPRNLYANTALAIVYEHFNGRLQAIEYRKKIQSLDPYNAPSLVELENDYILTDNRALAVATRDSILAMAPGTDTAKKAQSLLPK
jgi:tetratricopeptide (TPR) repeat protein